MSNYFSHFLNNRLTKIFNSQTASSIEPTTYRLDVGSISDKGRVRSANQDYIGLFSSPDKDDFLAVVADGMGGHQAGDIASRMAVEEIQHSYYAQLKIHSPEQALRHVFEVANSAVFDCAQQFPEYQGMGTTLIALFLHKSAAYFAHTGDSRLYHIYEHTIQQLSTDHTLVAEMLNRKLINAEQAKNHPDKNIIMHAIGTREDVFVETCDSPLPLQIGDCFLLCSDGLYDLVDDTEMLDYATTYTAQQACQELVQLANTRGGYDNISVIIIKILQESTISQSKEAPITRT